MVSVRERMAKSKAELDESNTENKMAQLALDKAAHEFRQLHAERQEMADRSGFQHYHSFHRFLIG